MTTKQALYRSILEDPISDTLRLVYADYLEEQGEEVIEFIRPKYHLATYDRNELARRWKRYAKSLFNDVVPKSWDKWLASFPDPDHPSMSFVERVGGTAFSSSRMPIYFSLRHGLTDHIAIKPSWFMKNARLLFSKVPISSIVLMNTRPEDTPNSTHKFDEVNHQERNWQFAPRHPTRIGGQMLNKTLFDLLPIPTDMKEFQWSYRFWSKFYPDKRMAYEALSRACLIYGREQAGLSPLKFGPL